MDIDEKERILISAKVEKCKRSFYFFFKEFWEEFNPSEYVDNWHIEFICDQLQYTYNRWANNEQAIDLLINVPPGTSKSSMVTVAFPVWLWVKNPKIKIITASYSSTLSTNLAVKSRDLIRSDKFILYFPHLSIKKDSDNKTEYQNNFMGERFSTSVNGSVTGMHGDFIFMDDIQNPREAGSDVEREKANSFASQTLSSRKTNKNRSVTILVMQRLHVDDISGKWLEEKKNIHHICLPAMLDDNIKPEHAAKFYKDGLLDANRLDKEALQIARVDLKEYGFSGQFQQKPTPDDGVIWRKWFIPIDIADMPRIKELSYYGTDWDLAYTKNENNSANAYITSGELNNKMYIYDLGFKHLEFPELINYMKTKPFPHYIEAKASGKSAKQTLTSVGIPAIEVDVDGGDKIPRAKFASSYAEAGMIYVNRSILDILYNDSKQGILMFPNNTHNDLADALAQAISRHFKKQEVWFS